MLSHPHKKKHQTKSTDRHRTRETTRKKHKECTQIRASISAPIVLHREAGFTTNTKPKQQKRKTKETKKQEKDKT
jgi:hypothetical protein